MLYVCYAVYEAICSKMINAHLEIYIVPNVNANEFREKWHCQRYSMNGIVYWLCPWNCVFQIRIQSKTIFRRTINWWSSKSRLHDPDKCDFSMKSISIRVFNLPYMNVNKMCVTKGKNEKKKKLLFFVDQTTTATTNFYIFFSPFIISGLNTFI